MESIHSMILNFKVLVLTFKVFQLVLDKRIYNLVVAGRVHASLLPQWDAIKVPLLTVAQFVLKGPFKGGKEDFKVCELYQKKMLILDQYHSS